MRPESLNLNTIIFKNFDVGAPVHDTFLVIEFAGSKLETEKVHEKDILWTKQNISGNFSNEDAVIEFSVYQEIDHNRTLIGKNSILISDIRPKHRMYSYKLPIYSHRNLITGELLLHYEFRRLNDSQVTTRQRDRIYSYSIDNHNAESKVDKLKGMVASQERSLAERYIERIVDSNFNGQRRRHREHFYYGGKNVKFTQAPRFRTEVADESKRSIGPGSYCLPSVFDRHKVIE